MSNLTGKPSVDRPWLKYYPEQLRQMIKEPKCTVLEYLKSYCPGEDVAAIDFYGKEVLWKTVFDPSGCRRGSRGIFCPSGPAGRKMSGLPLVSLVPRRLPERLL